VLRQEDASAKDKAFALVVQFAGGQVFSVNRHPYVALGQIGKGGSSKVYKVMDQRMNLYALKRVDLEGADSNTIAMYENEARLLKSLDSSPFVVRLLDGAISRKPGRRRIELVLELGDADLAKLLSNAKANGGLSENYVRLYWQQMLEAVGAVHDHRVVHGDLKPANFVTVSGRLKLIDFGIAKAIQGDTTNISRDTQIGTLNYISPEALIDTNDSMTVDDDGRPSPKMKLGRASDVWSLGCILYVMVHGKAPFAHLSMVKKIRAITDDRQTITFPTPEPIALVNDVLKKCLLRDPKQRATIPDLLQHPFLRPTVALLAMQQQLSHHH
jgi:serine/threonine-protein kinase TTK/MPS1